MARAIVTMPREAKRGDIIEIRTLIAHPMETGYRRGEDGQMQPRNIIGRLTCHYGDDLVFMAELFPAISANPFVSFFTVATTSATLRFTWQGDNGFSQTENIALTVA